jgi:hypothetical protein
MVKRRYARRVRFGRIVIRVLRRCWLLRLILLWTASDRKAVQGWLFEANAVVDSKDGVLLQDCQLCNAAPHATNPKFAERLWTLSEKLVKQEFPL